MTRSQFKVLARGLLLVLPLIVFAAATADGSGTESADEDFSSSEVFLPEENPNAYFTYCTAAQESSCFGYCTDSMADHPNEILRRADCVAKIQWFPVYLSTFICQCTISPARGIDFANGCQGTNVCL